MSKIKVTAMTAVALVAVFALSVVASASAAGWKVNGAALTGSAALATTAQVDAAATLTIVPGTGAKVKIVCSGSLLRGEKPEIDSTNTGMASKLTFEGCATTEPTKCALSSSTINTNPISATVTTATAPADHVTFTPLTKKTFAEVPFSATNTCAFNEPEPVNGAVTVNAPTGQTENGSQAIEGLGSIENNSLEVAGDKSFIEGGKALLKLASGSKWSFS
jgi:hypothetical protein